MNIPATGVVLTWNGEAWLRQCLQSLDFCKRILVIDSQSEDNTVDIARECGADVVINPWPGPVKQFEFAFAHVSTPWVVSLDQDEILSEDLKREVIDRLSPDKNNPFSGFFCPRRSYYFDRFLKYSGWYPDYLLRVFSLESTSIHTSGPHYGFHTPERTAKLNGDIVHYPYANLQEHLNKINYYTQAAAEEMYAQEKRGGAIKAVLHGFARFLKIFILKRGFLDGRAGFVLAINSFFYTFQKYIRLTELNTKKLKKP